MRSIRTRALRDRRESRILEICEMRINDVVIVLIGGLLAISTVALQASDKGNSGLARSVKNGGFESPVDPRPNAGVTGVDDWLASSKVCACRPSTNMTSWPRPAVRT